MAASKKAQEKKDSTKQSKKNIGVLAFIIIIIIVIAGALVYGLNSSSQSQTSIGVFQSNFDSVSNVSVVVTAYNGTTLAASTGCAASIIEELTATHGSAHKNASMIGFYVINSTNCLYTEHLGLIGATYLNATPRSCINMSKSTPSIFINYSSTNKTTITQKALYISGTIGFLTQCGVATEITAT